MAAIRIEGRRGAGKSVMALMLGIYFKGTCNAPLYSNDVKTVDKGIAKIATEKDLLSARGSVFILDELWVELDSWDFKDNSRRGKIKDITHWWQLQRHNDLILIYTTQKGGQMTNRVRESDDLVIYCEKTKIEDDLGIADYRFSYSFIDGYSGNVLRVLKLLASDIKQFFELYDYAGRVQPVIS